MAESIRIRKATLADVEDLLQLYFVVYGTSYPLAIGTDRLAMTCAITSDAHVWLVAEDAEQNRICGSVAYELDRINRIGKVTGLVVHPDYRGRKIANHLIGQGSDELLAADGPVNSLYATTRTTTVGPQLVLLHEGYHPLGIFPNAHKLQEFETLTLVARFREGVLSRRALAPAVPLTLQPILRTVNERLGVRHEPKTAVTRPPLKKGEQLEFEMVYAPSFVRKKFMERFQNAADRFYPFHIPNLLIASTNGEVEIYAYFGRTDGYCTLVSFTTPPWKLQGRLHRLFVQLREFGVSYVETLTRMEDVDSVGALLETQFLPSAIYPAMLEVAGQYHDFVLLSRTMEPLNFKDMEVVNSFKPYVDQYVEQWKKMYLDSLGVFNDHPI